MTLDLENLDKKIKEAEGKSNPLSQKTEKDNEKESMQNGAQAGIEFVASIAAGIGIGLGLDSWLDTAPVFFLIFFFLGIGTGFYNVYRVTQNMGVRVGFSELHSRKKQSTRSPNLKSRTNGK